ncbi:MAG: hypothetical protein V4581_11485 [Bacteroidota bacterium]
MKKYLPLLFALTFLMSCKKDVPKAPNPASRKTVTTKPDPVKKDSASTVIKTVLDTLPQKPVHLNPDKVFYEVINYCLAEKRIAGQVQEMTAFVVHYRAGIANKIEGLTKEDIRFMKKQAADTTRITIDTLRLARKIKIVSHNDYKDKTSYSYISLSRPIFSKDYTTAYIECNNYCGNLCGGGMLFILHRNSKGKWEIKDRGIIPTWIS